MLTFRIYWTDGYGRRFLPGGTLAVAREYVYTDVQRHSLDAAIFAACNLLKRPSGDLGALAAHGFYVRVLND